MPSFFLGNPMGLWALLALPVIVLIHSLQQRAVRVRVSTLFLLERVTPQSAEGARLERFRQSVPFWMQILAVVLLAWMLSEPRWISLRSEQVVVVVLEASASMSAFKGGTRPLLARKLDRLTSRAGSTRFHLLVSDVSKPPLYGGDDLKGFLRAYDEWEPMKAGHDPAPALATARGLVPQGRGVVIYVTDHAAELPADVGHFSAAEPIDNMGFTGVTVTLSEERNPSLRRMRWRALVRNAGNTTQSREWWLERNGERGNVVASDRNKLTVEAGRTLIIEGEMSPDVGQAVLVMDADRFTLDDRVYLQKPEPPPLRVAVRCGAEAGDILRRMILAIPNVELVAEAADVTVATTGDNVETDAVFVEAPAAAEVRLDGRPVAAEHHPLVRDLNWSGLMTSQPVSVSVVEGDLPLLWRGDRPLLLQRSTVNAQDKSVTQLFLNWDVTRSNAHRLPAMLVLLHRWMHARRDRLPRERVDNFETGQRLELPAVENLQLHMEGQVTPWMGRVPERPGPFEVKVAGKCFVRGAAQFMDARESDFRQCAAADTTESFMIQAAERMSEADALTPIWMLALLGCLVVSWAWRPRLSGLIRNLKTRTQLV